MRYQPLVFPQLHTHLRVQAISGHLRSEQVVEGGDLRHGSSIQHLMHPGANLLDDGRKRMGLDRIKRECLFLVHPLRGRIPHYLIFLNGSLPDNIAFPLDAYRLPQLFLLLVLFSDGILCRHLLMVEPPPTDQQLAIVTFGDGIVKLLAQPRTLGAKLPEKPKALQADDGQQCDGDEDAFPLHFLNLDVSIFWLLSL